jgi:hypothetical protein
VFYEFWVKSFWGIGCVDTRLGPNAVWSDRDFSGVKAHARYIQPLARACISCGVRVEGGGPTDGPCICEEVRKARVEQFGCE